MKSLATGDQFNLQPLSSSLRSEVVGGGVRLKFLTFSWFGWFPWQPHPEAISGAFRNHLINIYSEVFERAYSRKQKTFLSLLEIPKGLGAVYQGTMDERQNIFLM